MIILLYICLLLFCIVSPNTTISTAKETILLWATSVLPSLFPFFIISKCILYNGGISYFAKFLKPITKYLNLPQNIAFPLSMSLLCGYQTGSKTVASMNIKDTEYYANICFSASPIFIIGTIGTIMLNSTKTGYILYVIHVCTLVIFATLYSTKNHPQENNNLSAYEKGNFIDAISSSTYAILNVCGYMVIYSLFTKILSALLPLKYNIITSGIIEFTFGIKNAVNELSNPLPIISFFLSFGGICVITQCFSNYTKINKIKFITNRILCGTTSFLLCILYKKTALYAPILLTIIIVISAHIFRRKKFY